MSKGTRALIMAGACLVVAAWLAWQLKDGGVFEHVATLGIGGKFLYDGARDVSATKGGE